MHIDLEFLESAPSTMDVARANVMAGRVRFDATGRPEPAGVLARTQTAGRGQRGRHWFAQPGECLCATYYFKHGSLTPATAWHCAFLAGAAGAEVLKGICSAAFPRKISVKSISASGYTSTPEAETGAATEYEKTTSAVPHVGLKWPNDMLLNGKKAGGILIEMVQSPPDHWVALIGIGINLNVRDFPPELQLTATSLAREGLPEADWQEMGLLVANALASYATLYHDKGIEPLLERWRQYDETPGRYYETVHNGATVRGRATGIEAEGALRLQLEDGTMLCVQSAFSIKEVIRS